MIDVLTSDQDVAKSLDQTLHAPFQDQSCGQDIGRERTDQCPYFLCQKDPAFDTINRMVRNFSVILQSKDVKPGDLLLLSSQHQPEQEAYILGVVMKKPMLQTLVSATVTDLEAQYTLTQKGLPIIHTSHQVFLRFVRAGGLGAVEVSVEVWRCQPFLDNDHLKVNPTEQVGQFQVGAEKPACVQKVATAKLPASLQVRRKPKPKNTDSKRKGRAVAKAAFVMDPCSSSGEDAVSTGALASECSSGSASDMDLDPNKESETMVPPSAIVAAEEKNMGKVAREIQDSDQLREQTAEEIRLTEKMSSMPPSQKGSSFFSRSIGLDEVSVAPTGRSICLCCRKPIPNGSVRCSYFYSKSRLNGWLHAHCTTQYITLQADSGVRDSAISRLQEIITNCESNHASSSKSKPVVVEIKSWANKILAALQR